MSYYHLLLNFNDLVVLKIQHMFFTFIFLCMIMYMCGAHKGQKGELNPREREL